MTMLRIFAALLIALSGLASAQEPPKPAPDAKQPAKPPADPKAPVLQIEKSAKPADCVIKPVMTDDELRACGARIAK
jgi:hypothetical protein